jgi:colanic acid/amylovoran biosynthesis glycosyltransferase
MKIAFILSAFPALSETFILNQITGLIDLGHDVKIFALINPGEKKVHSDVDAYHLMERVYYADLPRNRIKRVLHAFRLLLVNFHRAPISLLKALNFFKYGTQAMSLSLFYTFISFLKAGTAYDIIHCHFGPNGNTGVMLRELGIRGKIVTSFHGYDISMFVKQEGSNAYRELFRQGDLFTANSNHTKGRLITAGCPEHKIQKLPVGLDINRFSYKPREQVTGQKTKIGTIARLVEKKGVEYSIKAAAQVMRKHPEIEYRIVGDGPLRESLEQLVGELGCSEKIRFLGWLDSDEVIRFMDELHIFMLTSVTARSGDQEGQGLVLQEAQAMGIPVLATLHNGLPEGVIDGGSGFLVPERDVDALAEKLEYLIDHPERWAEMGWTGRKFVEDKYDIVRLNRQLEDIYKKCVVG